MTVKKWPGSQIPIDLFDPSAPPSFEERRREASSRKKVHGVMEDAVLEALGVMGMNRLRNAVKRGDIDLNEIPGMRAGEGTTMFQTVYPLERLHWRCSWCQQIPCQAGLGSGPRASSKGVVAVEVLLERSGAEQRERPRQELGKMGRCLQRAQASAAVVEGKYQAPGRPTGLHAKQTRPCKKMPRASMLCIRRSALVFYIQWYRGCSVSAKASKAEEALRRQRGRAAKDKPSAMAQEAC